MDAVAFMHNLELLHFGYGFHGGEEVERVNRNGSTASAGELEDVIAATLDASHQAKRPSTGARFGRDSHHIRQLVADERLDVIEEVRDEEALADAARRN